jgi:hypothetical protein
MEIDFYLARSMMKSLTPQGEFNVVETNRQQSTGQCSDHRRRGQQVLNALWDEKAIPFKLNVGRLTKGMGEHTIHFHDSRIRTARIPLTAGHSFRDIVRAAVLARVAQMSGPLTANPAARS